MKCKICGKSVLKNGLCFHHYFQTLSEAEKNEFRRKRRKYMRKRIAEMTPEEKKIWTTKHKIARIKFRKTEKYRRWLKDYNSRPKVKKKRREYQRKYYSIPEVRKKTREYQRKYYASPEKRKEQHERYKKWYRKTGYYKIHNEDYARVFRGTLFVSSGDIDYSNSKLLLKKKIYKKILYLYEMKKGFKGKRYRLQIVDLRDKTEKWYETNTFPKFMKEKEKKKEGSLQRMIGARKK